MSSDSEGSTTEPRRKRGKFNKSQHIKEIEKSARQRGEDFVTSKGNLIEARVTGPNCDCRKKCMVNLTIEEKNSIISAVYSGRPKNKRDTYLLGLIDRFDVHRHRALSSESKQNTSSFKYYAIKNDRRVEVCRKAFMSLHSLSNNVIRRLNRLRETNQSPVDMRGKHKNRGNTLDPEIICKIHDHILSFPTKEAHYTSTTVIYLEACLTVKKMYSFFIDNNPSLENVVKYEYYLKYFNDNYGYRFGRPQVDVCSTCEELNTKIKSPTLNDVAKRVAVAELVVHKNRAKKFYNKFNEVSEICKNRRDVMAITFDYMQNLLLPFMPVQEMFYLRKLWFYVFNIHDIGKNRSVFYTYTEGTAKRGPNEVCSFLNNFFNTIPDEVKELHVFSDACGGQNRNHTVTRMLLAMTMKNRFSIIHQYFPVPGHSFLPCGRNFSVIKRAVRKFDRIYIPSQYENLIKTAKKFSPTFEVKSIKNDDILNSHGWWPQYFKKTAIDIEKKGEKFSISQYRHLVYKSELKGYVKASNFIDGLLSVTFKLNKTKEVLFPEDKIYQDKVAVNPKRIQDISKVRQYIPQVYQGFYDDILNLPTSNGATSDDDDGH